MKKLVVLIALCGTVLTSNVVFAQQDTVKKAMPSPRKRVSPQASATETLKNGTVVSITYSQPFLKNRIIGKDIAPFEKVWRTGANEATTFEVIKDVKVEGKALPAGKYSLYTIPGEKEWTIIFNKIWDQWGTIYAMEQDQLRIKVTPQTSTANTDMLTFLVSKDGQVSINWGLVKVPFQVN
jgi:hypothetical protein